MLLMPVGKAGAIINPKGESIEKVINPKRESIEKRVVVKLFIHKFHN
jgi:hypothetical protein